MPPHRATYRHGPISNKYAVVSSLISIVDEIADIPSSDMQSAPLLVVSKLTHHYSKHRPTITFHNGKLWLVSRQNIAWVICMRRFVDLADTRLIRAMRRALDEILSNSHAIATR
ncbi:MAG: hypothetical protein ABIR91_04885 [Candidatus Saccharimonadales bacterium]